MEISSSQPKELPDLDNLWTSGFIIFLASNFLGVPAINVFNEMNPWIVCDHPFVFSFIVLSALAVLIRRVYFNLIF